MSICSNRGVFEVVSRGGTTIGRLPQQYVRKNYACERQIFARFCDVSFGHIVILCHVIPVAGSFYQRVIGPHKMCSSSNKPISQSERVPK